MDTGHFKQMAGAGLIFMICRTIYVLNIWDPICSLYKSDAGRMPNSLDLQADKKREVLISLSAVHII